MPIDTRIEGNPESVRGISDWLRSTLQRGVAQTTNRIYDARNSANSGWQGPAGDAFSGKMGTAAEKTEQFSTAIRSSAEGFDRYAADLRRAQDDMRGIRERAAGAGLTVTGDVIEDPGPAPATPGTAPSGAAGTPEAVSAHESAAKAAADHASKVAAYEQAQKDADGARHLEKLAADTLVNMKNDVTQKWFIVVGDLTNGAAGTLAAKHTSILQKQSQHLTDEAARLLDQARTAPAGTTAASIYDDVDRGRAAAYQADDVAKAAKDVDGKAARWGFRAGGALAVGGVAYDIANGKPVGQAVVSGGVGFGASVAAGAAVGTMIPVPVVGTAVGAVVGAGVGIFASGVTDSIWQNGVGEVGGAIEDGAEAVGDTASAIGGAAEDAWNAVF
ncbi:hypothetical protein [Saccharopolyspora dendranthemae]|uniref:Type VII secretion system (Wss) protein ESAT-6 n=1 Tax=Saccharopolyspora dendranthemae TaxID=1181886 RepID=A0A561TZQ7_9PSEU|nr:hypothetical protein [Saccharopolyspora dendranthemae]TWF92572.1 hypothetical protein FHU35_17215 [Saccharopolyspora dendranthemae]